MIPFRKHITLSIYLLGTVSAINRTMNVMKLSLAAGDKD